eukprot:EG_transcript_12374
MRRLQAADGSVRTLTLSCQNLGEEGIAKLTPLKTTLSLRSLTMNLPYNVLGDHGVQTLVELLEGLNGLQTLRLHLGNNGITDAGAAALARLRTLPALCCLTLSLWGNKVGDEGAIALALLQEAPLLQTLNLRLGCNGIGRTGAIALNHIRSTPTLLAFSLDLSYNPIRTDGDPQLQSLADANPAHTFSLYRSDLCSWEPDN